MSRCAGHRNRLEEGRRARPVSAPFFVRGLPPTRAPRDLKTRGAAAMEMSHRASVLVGIHNAIGTD